MAMDTGVGAAPPVVAPLTPGVLPMPAGLDVHLSVVCSHNTANICSLCVAGAAEQSGGAQSSHSPASGLCTHTVDSVSVGLQCSIA